jgi:hypothetical protein
MDHLMNCHGEWVVLLTALSNIPLVGVWIRYKIGGCP